MIEKVLDRYKSIIYREFGTEKIGVCFFSSSEKYADRLEKIIINEQEQSFFNYSLENEQVGEDSCLLSEVTRCFIDGDKFLKIITPFLNVEAYDFIVAPVDNLEIIYKNLEKKSRVDTNSSITFPLIDLPTSEIKSQVLDFLLDDDFRTYCRSKHIKTKRGIILGGPPGVGKSLVLSWLKVEAEKNKIYFEVYKDSESFLNNVESLFSMKEKRILVFEEFDTFLQERENSNGSKKTISGNLVLQTMLNTLDGIKEITDTVFIFTTNHPDCLDKAMIRPGRIDKIINFELPSKEQQHKFLKAYLPQYEDKFLEVNILNPLKEKNINVSYAILKGISDGISIQEYNCGKRLLTNEEIVFIVNDICTSANNGNEVKDTKKYIL